MKIFWSIIGAACMLPLCAADLPIPRHVPYTGEHGALVHQLVFHHCPSAFSISTLKQCLVVNKLFNTQSSKILNEYRDKLKTHVEPLITIELDAFRYTCPFAYSPDGLEAALIDASPVMIVSNCCFITYFYYDNNQKNPIILESEGTFTTHECNPTKPFFTKNYLCCDLRADPKSSVCCNLEKPKLGVVWHRKTESHELLHFKIDFGTQHAIAYDWILQKLPYLHEKIIQRAYHYTNCETLYHPAGEGISAKFLVIDFTKMNLLTPKDIATLHAFSDADWAQLKPKSLQFLLFNMLACYGNLTTEMVPDKPQAGFLKQLDRCLGKQKIALDEGKDGSTSEFQVSRIYEAISFINSEGKEFKIVYGKSPYTDTTKQYITLLKKEGVFVEKEWDRDLKKRMNMWELAKAQLKKNRLKLKLYNDHFLMRYDAWSSRLTIVRPIVHRLMEILQNKRVPRNIDVDSITLFRVSDAPPSSAKHYFAKPTDYRISYNVNPHTENDDDSYDSDIIVESDDEQNQ